MSDRESANITKEKMTVLYVKPGEKPKRIEIENDLEALQRAVGGYIEAVYPYEDPVALIVNEEGKLNGLPLNRALRDEERGLGGQHVEVPDEVLLAMAQIAGGDARMALNLLEGAAAMLPTTGGTVTLDMLEEITGERVQRYDKTGDNHYDTASAFIKSMRGSDPDAALHYLARMLAAGEDVKFIARRIVICASEDVGNADPMALPLAMAAAEAVQFVGMPEARITLAQAVTYIASAPKSNAAYLGIDAALKDVQTKDCGTVPKHLRDSHYKGAAALGHGQTYCYPHDYPGHFKEQAYLPDKIREAHYYEPTDIGREKVLHDYLRKCWPERF